MKILNPSARRSAGSERVRRQGFTMVEIALCLAVIGFALVAIIGVLPTGIQVQKENREETIINQDGLFLLDAIRSGSRAFEELTNYVEEITVTNLTLGGALRYTTNSTVPATRLPDGTLLTRSAMILGLLSAPKYEMLQGRMTAREVTAQMRSVTGTALDKDAGNKEFAFRYQVTSEIIPFQSQPPEMTDYRQAGLPPAIRTARYLDYLVATNQAVNFYEIRLTLRWPLIRRGAQLVPGNNVKVFRTLANGRLEVTDPPRLYRFVPANYAQLTPVPAAP